MTQRIPDSIKLMGLIIKTKPYEYDPETNIVTCAFESHVDLQDLIDMKKYLENERDNLKDEMKSDENISLYNDEIYFLDTIILELQGTVN